MRFPTLDESARAAADIEAAAEHYRAQAGPAASFAFIEKLEAVYALVARHPEIGSPRYGLSLNLPGLRHRRLARYPWLVFWIVRQDRIEIIRVLNARRDIPAALLEGEQDQNA